FRLLEKQLRDVDSLFNATIYTFVFRPSDAWFLTVTDPLYATNHLHERMVQRAVSNYRSLSHAQDDLSVLWPTLVELGQQRRHNGRAANVTDFVTPWGNGLVFGNLEKFTGPVELFAPTLLDFKNGLIQKRKLFDFYSQGGERLAVICRSYVGEEQLRDGQ